MPTRYLICGGRDFADEALLDKALKALILHPEDAVVITGAARGADRLGAMWAHKRGAKLEAYPAEWLKYERAAGPIRNRRMIEEGKPDVVLAFPGGAGTADMVKQARAARIVTIVITGEGGDWYGQVSGSDDGLTGIKRTYPK